MWLANPCGARNGLSQWGHLSFFCGLFAVCVNERFSNNSLAHLDSQKNPSRIRAREKIVELFAIEPGQGKDSGGTVVLVEGFFDCMKGAAGRISMRGAPAIVSFPRARF